MIRLSVGIEDIEDILWDLDQALERQRMSKCAFDLGRRRQRQTRWSTAAAFATTAADRLRILERYRRIAMVGLSSNPFRPSHFAAIYMLSEGYDVTPVNPREAEVLGRRSYASLRDVPGPVEIVDIFREPAPCRRSSTRRSRSAPK